MIFSKNRFPLFRIMLQPAKALLDRLENILNSPAPCIGKPASAMQGSSATSEIRQVCATMNLQSLRKRLEPTLRRFFHLYWRFARGMTLGVRAVVLDRENRIFLVKHTYVSGWHLPGGGVEPGETFRDALRRELAEEGGIELTGEPVLHGLLLNRHVSRRDHVAVYLVRHFSQDRLPEPNHEIAACGFFETQALPAETTTGTRMRISEVIEGRAPKATWR
jgi:ADP-ribose pyrophosphatase YjhB (NUDIX family)